MLWPAGGNAPRARDPMPAKLWTAIPAGASSRPVPAGASKWCWRSSTESRKTCSLPGDALHNAGPPRAHLSLCCQAHKIRCNGFRPHRKTIRPTRRIQKNARLPKEAPWGNRHPETTAGPSVAVASRQGGPLTAELRAGNFVLKLCVAQVRPMGWGLKTCGKRTKITNESWFGDPGNRCDLRSRLAAFGTTY